jgi:hypothetical protein
MKVSSASSAPLLFVKRLPMSQQVAAQFIGTDTEIDPKQIKPESSLRRNGA